jgi:tRNA pseudouridine32 synthase / 23S rRNA pseudouridine746 synthase
VLWTRIVTTQALTNNAIVVKFVNNRTLHRAHRRIIQILFLQKELMTMPPYTLVLDSADFIAIHKAPDISVHRDDSEQGLVTRIGTELGYDKLYLVHRLDRMTSGLLLLAKTATSCAELAQLFAQRSIEKYYVALSAHKPLKKQGLVRGDMERSRNGSWRLARTHNDPALTRFFSRSVQPGLRLFTLRPGTGKTHQLRVAMKSLGAPILGDGRYGGGVADRGYLHAYALRFEYAGESFTLCEMPREGQWFDIAAVRTALQEQNAPWLLPWGKTEEKTTAQPQ